LLGNITTEFNVQLAQMAPNTKDTTAKSNVRLYKHQAINYTSAYCPI
jgi:hypothetical protein